MQIKGTITFAYNIPDDPAERKKRYGVDDVQHCLAIDEQNFSDEPEVALMINEDSVQVNLEVMENGMGGGDD